jgi:hypothetical protein
VQLAIAERIFGVKFASLGHDFKISVFDLPLGGGAVLLRPELKILAVE